jgi:hypothetical protein
MMVCFHNFTGVMPIAMDGHMYVAIPPPTGVPVPMPHVANAMFLAIANRVWRVATKVWVGMTPGLQSSWARLLVNHAPIPVMPPQPALEAAALATTIVTSSSQPVMTVHSVVGQGQPLMCCLALCAGANQNCGIFPSGGPTLNICTVLSSPTLGDYVNAAIGIAINGVFNTLSAIIPENPVSIAVAVLQNLDDLGDAYGVHLPTPVLVLFPILGLVRLSNWLPGAVGGAAQKAIDGEK